ncbi:MAG: phosphate ABC transporter permease subunit PstC [Wenzhouxiangellaceae bacterium]
MKTSPHPQTPAGAALLAAASSPQALRRRQRIDTLVRGVLFLAAAFSVLVTIAIVYVLLSESLVFFQSVSLGDFLTDRQWTPLFTDAHFGILPLLSATLLVAMIALLVAIPGGTLIAIYLSEFAPARLRDAVKPVLELLGGIPTVVYGYFALLFVTPMLQQLMPELPGFNLLAPGLVMGIMIIPYVSSLSEDAMRSVPQALREAGYAMGATRLQTAWRVVLPAAFSGVAAAYILGLSRAIGETMVVAIAGGLQPNLSFDPTEPAATMTAFIVQVSMGDAPHGSIAYQTIFAVGLSLFVITLLFNGLGLWLRRRIREVY